MLNVLGAENDGAAHLAADPVLARFPQDRVLAHWKDHSSEITRHEVSRHPVGCRSARCRAQVVVERRSVDGRRLARLALTGPQRQGGRAGRSEPGADGVQSWGQQVAATAKFGPPRHVDTLRNEPSSGTTCVGNGHAEIAIDVC
jgi:hypothetical protein